MRNYPLHKDIAGILNVNEPERCLQEDNSKAQALGIPDEQVQALGIVHAQALPTRRESQCAIIKFRHYRQMDRIRPA